MDKILDGLILVIAGKSTKKFSPSKILHYIVFVSVIQYCPTLIKMFTSK